eukprot:7741448-Pyramimonas_sp.AAC.1
MQPLLAPPIRVIEPPANEAKRPRRTGAWCLLSDGDSVAAVIRIVGVRAVTEQPSAWMQKDMALHPLPRNMLKYITPLEASIDLFFEYKSPVRIPASQTRRGAVDLPNEEFAEILTHTPLRDGT